MLRRTGYALVSEFLAERRRPTVRLRSLKSNSAVTMYHGNAIELARGATTIAAIVTLRDADETSIREKSSVAADVPSCPVCRTTPVSTSNKTQRLDAYWQCDSCGHIWNPARMRPRRRTFL